MHTLNHTHIHKHRHEWLQSRILLCLNRVKNLKDFLENTLFSKSEVKIKFYVFQYNVTNLKFPTTFFFLSYSHIRLPSLATKCSDNRLPCEDVFAT